MSSRYERRLERLFQNYVESDFDTPDDYILHEIRRRKDDVSIEQSITLQLLAFQENNVPISVETMAKVDELRRTVWRKANVVRLNERLIEKEQQYCELTSIWDDLRAFLRADNGAEQFRQVASNLINTRPARIAISMINEMGVLLRKPDTFIVEALHCTLAFIVLLRATGMRSIQAINLTRDSFEGLETGAVLITKIERKCGNLRNTQRMGYVRVEPHQKPEECTLFDIARHMHRTDLPNQPFGFGFTRRPNQSDAAFAKCVQRRFSAVLDVACVAVGKPDGLGLRKLHSFRCMCENTLARLGFPRVSRQEFIGWSATSAQVNYSFARQVALHSTIPFRLAGRKDKDDKAHHVWTIEMPSSLDCWASIHMRACAVGISSGMEVPHDILETLQDDHHDTTKDNTQDVEALQLMLMEERGQRKSLKRKLRRLERKLMKQSKS